MEPVSVLNPSVINEIEKSLLALPQADIPVTHRFAPGIYIREVLVPAGTVAIGQYHKDCHLNNLIKGRVLILNDDGSTKELVAPLTYISQPGQKFGKFLEETIWQTIHATTETDIEKLEDLLLIKSQNLINAEKSHLTSHEEDITDYQNILIELGMTEDQVRMIVENESDQVPMPDGDYKWMLSASSIHGRGVFSTGNYIAGEVIGIGRIGLCRTPLGRYTNHSKNPNAEAYLAPDGNVYVRATDNIKGCQGGFKGDEITLNYRQVTIEALKADKGYSLCHHS